MTDLCRGEGRSRQSRSAARRVPGPGPQAASAVTSSQGTARPAPSGSLVTLQTLHPLSGPLDLLPGSTGSVMQPLEQAYFPFWLCTGLVRYTSRTRTGKTCTLLFWLFFFHPVFILREYFSLVDFVPRQLFLCWTFYWKQMRGASRKSCLAVELTLDF